MAGTAPLLPFHSFTPTQNEVEAIENFLVQPLGDRSHVLARVGTEINLVARRETLSETH